MPLAYRCCPVSELILELVYAAFADKLAVEVHHVVGVVAKDAGRLILLYHDPIAIHKELDRILGIYVKYLSDLRREHDSSQLVYLTNYAC